MQKGKINVQSENIFPIIKKFLYSDHEIFLRELVSNAVDATQKLKTLSALNKFSGDLGDLTIRIKIDQKAKTITISDQGIGMSAEEVDKYINQIAFSGAEEFLQTYKGKSEVEANALIGHFGLGFYSAFMVAKQVEIITKSYQDTPAVRWVCDGSPDYELNKAKKEGRGTDIILHIADDSLDFLEEGKILGLLKKYCKFLPVPVEFGTEKYYEPSETEKDDKGEPKQVEKERARVINAERPLWKSNPSELKPVDYLSFYRYLYPMNFDDPLFNIHLNVDYPFNLTGILYFPKLKNSIEVQRDKIQLYCNQVFVTESVEGIVPEFLMLMHGVIDSPDIPLNVSRSYLQSDGNVKKISNHISKKVAEKLEEIYKNQREEFEKKWNDLKVFVQYGMMSDDKFYDRAKSFYFFSNVNGENLNIDNYIEKIKPLQTDKENVAVILYTNNKIEQHSYIENAKSYGYDVLEMNGVLDNHFLNFLESKLEKVRFVRVDADVVDKLIVKEEEIACLLSDAEKEKIKTWFEGQVEKPTYTIVFENLNPESYPVTITQNEMMRRMKEMSKMGGGGMMSFYGEMPDSYNLVVNTNHAVIKRLLEKDNVEEDVRYLVDLALLSHGLLKGEKLDQFLKRGLTHIS